MAMTWASFEFDGGLFLMSLAFAGHVTAGHLSTPIGSIVISICLTVAGGMMLFFPERAFRSDSKPRWLGLPLLCVGLVGVANLISSAL
jgi:hypothetical protein